VNFTKDDTFRINLLQCRPLQAQGLGRKVVLPERVKKDDVFFESHGYFLGGNVSCDIKRIIYVDPEGYSNLVLSDKYEIARIVGLLNRDIEDKEKLPTLLLGPGRWGTTTPSLGVTVKFAEINNMAALVEMAFSAGKLMPELSFGTHFFQDLVETKIFYAALFPEKKGVTFNRLWLGSRKNLLEDMDPGVSKYKNIIGVYDVKDLKVMSDVVSQRVMCVTVHKG
jgi:hypothetical protein